MRRFLQFRISTLFLLVFVCGVMFAWMHDREDFKQKLDESKSELQQSEALRDAQRMVMEEGWHLLFKRQPAEKISKDVEIWAKWNTLGVDGTVMPLDDYSYNSITKTAVPELIEKLRSEDIRIRARAARTLGNFRGAGSAISPLVEALRDDEHIVQWHAAWSLRKLSRDWDVSTAIPELNRLVNDSTMSAFAAQVLREIEPTTNVTPRLIELLDHKNADSRLRAVSELLQLGEPVSLSKLGKLLFDSDREVRRVAISAVSKLSLRDKPLAILTKAFSQEEDKDVKMHAARVLTQLDKENEEKDEP